MNTPYLLAILLLFAWPQVGESAADESLQVLQKKMEESWSKDQKTRKERETTFLSEHADRKAMLADLNRQLEEEKAKNEQLRNTFSQNEKLLAEEKEGLRQKVGELEEVFGSVRQQAKDLAEWIHESLVSSQITDRKQLLADLGESRRLPSIQEMERLWHEIRREIVESGRVVRFPGRVVTEQGVTETRDVVRVGLFGAVAGSLHLRYLAGEDRFTPLPRQPDADTNGLASSLSASREGIAEALVDPTRGVLLNLLSETPDFWERVDQGGGVGYFILFLGMVGLLLGVGRLLFLTRMGQKMERQLLHPDTPDLDNPLGRILAVAAERRGENPKNVELLIDEAILREIPRLTRGERLMRLLASVAPLLGLLGTVVGMIITFQVITLFGSGDPKLMAGGISQALVTTAQGLIVAVPLLFLHALVSARSRALVRILDQQSAGIIALAWEKTP